MEHDDVPHEITSVPTFAVGDQERIGEATADAVLAVTLGLAGLGTAFAAWFWWG